MKNGLDCRRRRKKRGRDEIHLADYDWIVEGNRWVVDRDIRSIIPFFPPIQIAHTLGSLSLPTEVRSKKSPKEFSSGSFRRVKDCGRETSFTFANININHPFPRGICPVYLEKTPT